MTNGEFRKAAIDKWEPCEQDMGKLRRNLQQMNAEQKTKYAKQLRALRGKVYKEAWDIFLAMNVYNAVFLKGDEADFEAFIDQAGKILDEEKPRQATALTRFLKTGELYACLEAMEPVAARIRYEAYAPYWLRKCRWDPETATWEDLWGNPWNPDSMTWITRHGDVTLYSLEPSMLKGGKDPAFPPQEDLMRREYQLVLAELGKGAGAAAEG